MQLSAAHLAARDLAARLPALQASFDLLDAGAGQATIEVLDATNAVLVTIPIADGAGTLNAETFQIVLSVPIEAQVATAGTPSSARVKDNTGALWADDITVSDDAPESTGEIKLASMNLQAGAFVRLTSAVFQG